MKASLYKMIDKLFSKAYFKRTCIVLGMVLVTICIIVAIIGYFKIIHVDAVIKKQTKQEQRK